MPPAKFLHSMLNVTADIAIILSVQVLLSRPIFQSWAIYFSQFRVLIFEQPVDKSCPMN